MSVLRCSLGFLTSKVSISSCVGRDTFVATGLKLFSCIMLIIIFLFSFCCLSFDLFCIFFILLLYMVVLFVLKLINFYNNNNMIQVT